MKEDLINTIRILGIGLNEIIVDIDLNTFMVNSIEYRSPNEIILHSFTGDFDYEVDFDELDEVHQKYVCMLISILLYN